MRLGQGTARPTTRSISARTSRSTSGGRLVSSQSFSSGPHFLAHDVLDASGRRRGPASRARRPAYAPGCRRTCAAAAAASGATRPGCRRHGCDGTAPQPWREAGGGGRRGVGLRQRGRRCGSARSGRHIIDASSCSTSSSPAAAPGAGRRAGRRPPPRSGCGGWRQGCPPSTDRALRTGVAAVGSCGWSRGCCARASAARLVGGVVAQCQPTCSCTAL